MFAQITQLMSAGAKARSEVVVVLPGTPCVASSCCQHLRRVGTLGREGRAGLSLQHLRGTGETHTDDRWLRCSWSLREEQLRGPPLSPASYMLPSPGSLRCRSRSAGPRGDRANPPAGTCGRSQGKKELGVCSGRGLAGNRIAPKSSNQESSILFLMD